MLAEELFDLGYTPFGRQQIDAVPESRNGNQLCRRHSLLHVFYLRCQNIMFRA